MNEYCIDWETTDYKYEWKIKQFSMQLNYAARKKRNITILKSSSFSINAGNISTWHFEIKLYGNEHTNKNYFGLYLHCDDVDNGSVWVTHTYSYVDAKGEEIFCTHGNPHEFTKSDNWGYSEFLEKSQLLKNADIYLPNDELTIVCQMWIKTDKAGISVQRHVSNVAKNNLSNDVAKLLENNEFSDITFQIHDKKFQVHRAILAARSPVFSTMLQHPMQEQNSNVVTIDDVEPGVFENMLQYIYGKKVIDIDRTAKDLLPVADRYDLKGLVKLCTVSLCKTVTVNNAAEIYLLAYRHNVEKLLEYMRYFIGTNLVDVMKTSAYKTMEKDHSQLLARLLRKWRMTKLRIN